MKAKFYQVGGCVRDELLGVKSKDIDFSVEADSFQAMTEAVIELCGGNPEAIKVSHPEFVTIRAVHPELGGVDFVLCRKDGTYSLDGRRPDFIEVGTLADDLNRRDFTVNALAKDEAGNIVDLHGGRADLEKRLLRCVGDTKKRLSEDSLRILRALRFSLTKGFTLAPELRAFIATPEAAESLGRISIERIREELLKCFEFDTMASLRMLEDFWRIRAHVFGVRNLKLTPGIVKK